MSSEYTASEKLVLALASMDAYNRADAPSIEMLTKSVGPLTVSKDSSFLKIGNLATDGFAAIAYTVSGSGTSLDGKTIIAYRGTDNPSLATNPVKGASGLLSTRRKAWPSPLHDPPIFEGMTRRH